MSFKKGFGAVRTEKKRQDDERAKRQNNLWRFFLGRDGDEADIRFLTEEPINFFEHTVKNYRNGKEVYDSEVCTRDEGDCKLCTSGDKPSFKGAFLIYDKRPFKYTDTQGKEHEGKGQLRLYVQGTRVLAQLDRLSNKYGLTNRDYSVTRIGSGTATTYTFDRGDEDKLTEAEITTMLPESLRPKYNGTVDSLYDIIISQLEPKAVEDDEDDDEVDTTKGKLVSIDDEEPAPKKKSGTLKSKKRPVENSVKKLFRNKK